MRPWSYWLYITEVQACRPQHSPPDRIAALCCVDLEICVELNQISSNASVSFLCLWMYLRFCLTYLTLLLRASCVTCAATAGASSVLSSDSRRWNLTQIEGVFRTRHHRKASQTRAKPSKFSYDVRLTDAMLRLARVQFRSWMTACRDERAVKIKSSEQGRFAC